MAVLPEYQNLDTGSNYRFGDKMQKPNVARSVFDLSHLSATTIPNAGEVFPISLVECLPSDDMDISVRSLLRVLPQVVPLYSRQRLYIYAFYSRLSDLWAGFDPFIRKGMTGDYITKVPTLTANNSKQGSVIANSLGDWLNLPIGFSDFNGVVSALPAMMYMRIWRDYFCNKNYYVNDRVIFPHDDADFRLNDSGELISAKNNNKSVQFDLISNTFGLPSYSGTVLQFGLFAHDYPQDYFTSALPWAQRGTAPSIDVNLSVDVSSVFNGNNFTISPVSSRIGDSSLPSYLAGSTPSYAYGYGGWYADAPSGRNEYVRSHWEHVGSSGASRWLDYSNPAAVSFDSDFHSWLTRELATPIKPTGTITNTATASGFGIFLDDIRQLAISQLELERMARTDGTFYQFGLTFFGEASRNATDYRATYVGGSYNALSFTEVLQTSATSSTPLGTYGGHGISADNNGYLGHLHCDDYGYLMILGCIMPDVYYSQGLDKHYTRAYQSDFFLPGREKLGMQAILNQELYYQNGNTESNNDLWAYQDRFDELRYLPNRIHGQIADPAKRSFYPYTQSRKFTQLPNFSKEFANANNVRKDYLAAPSEDAYTAQFSIDIRCVRALTYRANPAEVIN